MAVCYNARQDNKIQYSTMLYNTTTHITQNNIQISRQLSIWKITRINQEHIFYNTKTQKRVEPEVDKSILKTTRYAKE